MGVCWTRIVSGSASIRRQHSGFSRNTVFFYIPVTWCQVLCLRNRLKNTVEVCTVRFAPVLLAALSLAPTCGVESRATCCITTFYLVYDVVALFGTQLSLNQVSQCLLLEILGKELICFRNWWCRGWSIFYSPTFIVHILFKNLIWCNVLRKKGHLDHWICFPGKL